MGGAYLTKPMGLSTFSNHRERRRFLLTRMWVLWSCAPTVTALIMLLVLTREGWKVLGRTRALASRSLV
jgi:hypothetical protein